MSNRSLSKLERDFLDMATLYNDFAVELTEITSRMKNEDVDEFDIVAAEVIRKEAGDIADKMNLMKYALAGRLWFTQPIYKKEE